MRWPGQQCYTRSRLVESLAQVGIRSGELLMVHSSLRRIGWIEGGPPSFIHALLEVLGPEGTLVMPTFTFNLIGWELPPFEKRKTPSRVGVVTEVFWHLPNVKRSAHPTHSVAAVGPLAGEILGEGFDYEPLGVGSPLDRVRQFGGRILLAGVGQDRNSTVHIAESRAKMPYTKIPFSQGERYDLAHYIPGPNEKNKVLSIHETPGSSEGFSVLDHLLSDMGVAKAVEIGSAPSWIMESSSLCEAVEGLLEENPLLFLSSETPSEISKKRLRYMQQYLIEQKEKS